ncbi:hypothetical protein COO60DRAFT_1499365, partial [Scenedesmus sp. NREL 46B-D3]
MNNADWVALTCKTCHPHALHTNIASCLTCVGTTRALCKQGLASSIRHSTHRSTHQQEHSTAPKQTTSFEHAVGCRLARHGCSLHFPTMLPAPSDQMYDNRQCAGVDAQLGGRCSWQQLLVEPLVGSMRPTSHPTRCDVINLATSTVRAPDARHSTASPVAFNSPNAKHTNSDAAPKHYGNAQGTRFIHLTTSCKKTTKQCVCSARTHPSTPSFKAAAKAAQSASSAAVASSALARLLNSTGLHICCQQDISACHCS